MTVQTTEEKHYSDKDYRSLHRLYVAQHAETERLKARLDDLEAEARSLRADKGMLKAEIERLRKVEERLNNYQLVFNAIADACRIEAGHLSISVKRFKESLLAD